MTKRFRHRLVVFDLDGTLLPGTTSCREIARVAGRSAELEDLERRFSAGLVDTRHFAISIFRLWGLLADATLTAAVARAPWLKRIREALARLRARGGVPVLVTLSPEVFARRLQSWGFEHIFASHYPERAGETLDLERVLTPSDKPKIVRDLCARLDFQFDSTVAFGDGGSDEPLFRAVRTSVAVNGTARLRSLATHSYIGSDLTAAIDLVERAIADDGVGRSRGEHS